MKRIIFFLLILFISVSAFSKEFKYEPVQEEITGTVIQKMYYGPPGYGENPEQDKKVYPYLLKTDSPNDFIAVQGDPSNSTKKGISEIQIVVENDKLDLKKFLSKKVKIKGTFFQAISGGHQTEVLINVKEVLPN